MREIAPNVYVSTFYPGINVGCICTADGVVAVDAPLRREDALAWRDEMRRVTGLPIRWLVLTDSCLDRLTGAAWMGVPVIAGRGALRRFQEGGEAGWRLAIEEWARRRPGAVEWETVRLPVPQLAVAGRLTLHTSPLAVIELVAGPAVGSIWLRLPELGIVFAGDVVVCGAIPPLSASPDTRAWLKTLVEMRRERFRVAQIVPGRGPVCDKAATTRQSEYMQRMRRRVRSLHLTGGRRDELAGLMDEFLRFFPPAAEDQEWARREVLASLERLYDELSPQGVGSA